MRNFLEHKTAVFLIAATLVIAVLIGIFGAIAAGDNAGTAENLLGVAAEPGQMAATGAGGWFSGIFQYFGSVKALRAENEELKYANIELDKKVRDAQGLEQENSRLRAMLDLTKTESKLDLIAVQITAKDPSNWYSSFTINKGSDDGICKNQPVFTANRELVGQVYKVGSTWAEVITILDPESGVGSMIERSKDIGVLEGDSALRYQGKCRLGYLSRDTDIAVGDYVETSGMGGIYPKGLLIGKVTEIKEDNATMSKYATVEPMADISKLTEVFVLKSYTEEIKREEMTEEKNDEEDQNEEKEDKKESPKSTAGTAAPSGTSRPVATSGNRTNHTAASSTPKPTSGHSSSVGGQGGSNGSSQAMNGSELRD